jgi:hypothetical protein
MKPWTGKALETVNCCAFLKHMLTANLKFRAKMIFLFFLSLQCFRIFILEANILGHPLLKTNMLNYVPIKHKQMSFVSNGGKFKLYTDCSKRFNFSNAYSA